MSASAGSGKTFVMVERIIDKILRGVTIDQLFISTFTVKAAGELKERIEKKISQALQETTDNDLKIISMSSCWAYRQLILEPWMLTAEIGQSIRLHAGNFTNFPYYDG